MKAGSSNDVPYTGFSLFFIYSTAAFTSASGEITRLKLSFITSAQAVESKTTAGVPQASASAVTSPKVSSTEALKNTSAAEYNSARASLLSVFSKPITFSGIAATCSFVRPTITTVSSLSAAADRSRKRFSPFFSFQTEETPSIVNFSVKPNLLPLPCHGGRKPTYQRRCKCTLSYILKEKILLRCFQANAKRQRREARPNRRTTFSSL